MKGVTGTVLKNGTWFALLLYCLIALLLFINLTNTRETGRSLNYKRRRYYEKNKNHLYHRTRM